MLSNKKYTKRNNNKNNNKNTKKRNNGKSKIRKYKTLIGGEPETSQQYTYNFVSTIGNLATRKGIDNKSFDYPNGIAVSNDNKIYVADTDNHRIQVFNGKNLKHIETIGTTGESGSDNTKFNKPSGIAVSPVDNRIYVVDTNNHRIQVFNGNTNPIQYLETLGTTGIYWGTGPNNFRDPLGVAVSSDNRIYVADTGNHRVQVFDASKYPIKYITTIGKTSDFGVKDTQFKYPSGVAVSPFDNRIYVADKDNNRVQVFSGPPLESTSNTRKSTSNTRKSTSIRKSFFRTKKSNYSYLYTIKPPDTSLIKFESPVGIAVSNDNKIYIVNEHTSSIQVFNGNSNTQDYLATIGDGIGRGEMNFKFPTGVAVSPDKKNIYVADHLNNRIQIFEEKKI
jgi:DNA-binding beta-propeller fold protein YncE